MGELVDLRESTARYVVSPEGENNSWTLVRLDDLGDLYIRLLEGEAPGGTPPLAVSDGSHRAREIAEVASRAGGADGRVEARRLDEALEKLGDHELFSPSRWIIVSPARGYGGSWAGRSRLPRYSRSLREVLTHSNGVLRITVDNGLAL